MRREIVSLILIFLLISAVGQNSRAHENLLLKTFLMNRNPVERGRNLQHRQDHLMENMKSIVEFATARNDALSARLKTHRIKSGVVHIRSKSALRWLNSMKLMAANTGKISGTVAVNGTAALAPIKILAFDEHGFLNAQAMADVTTGDYQIESLAAGNYYVLTESNYVDEFYQNVISYDYTNWREAQLVTIQNDQITSGIDFDLARGVQFSGQILNAYDNLPMGSTFADFYFYHAVTHELVALISTFVNEDGKYAFAFNQTGAFKISCRMKNCQEAFYKNVNSPEEATVFEISSLNLSFQQIDFLLTEISHAETGAISGMVWEETSQAPIELAEVLAVNTADPEIWGAAFSMFELRNNQDPPAGSYLIEDLPVGEYIVCATDFVSGHTTEYYQNVAFAADATPVSVAAASTTPHIDFTLSHACAIAGTVTDQSGNPLDSALVIAIKSGAEPLSEFELMDKFINGQLHFGITDETGRYEIINLTEGSYHVNSFSFLYHPGDYLDETAATLVQTTSGGTVDNIDFSLDFAGSIQGSFLDATGEIIAVPVEAYIFNAQTNCYEYYAYFELTDETYRISGLSGGTYKLFFDVQPGEKPYISEFYDGHYAANLEGAKSVPVTQGEITSQVDVSIDIGGILQGRIALSNGSPVGADTLFQSLVILYDQSSGEYLCDRMTTFCGGYRMAGVPPGDYKVCALPLIGDNAATWLGNGDTFDDPQSQSIKILSGQGTSADITLETAVGSIAGKVVKDTDFMPMDLVYILVYDESGHVVSAGVSSVLLGENRYTGGGLYRISGLRNGTYYLRSWIIFALHPYFTEYIDLHYNQECYDEWYDGILANPDLIENTFDFYRLNFIPPFAQTIHPQATPVTLTAGQNHITNINFELDPLEPTGIAHRGATSPTSELRLHQNYPNPFNSETLIRFNLGETSDVELAVYNLAGQNVAVLTHACLPAGSHVSTWNGRDRFGKPVASGMYYCVLTAGERIQSIKLLLLK
ncbi:T9SS type A sorting domain-containing protein [candidate division KSB1 bacterium]|nr:T9SS type A sorting domain-containing protein [candidate division KSB1 bacterium]